MWIHHTHFIFEKKKSEQSFKIYTHQINAQLALDIKNSIHNMKLLKYLSLN